MLKKENYAQEIATSNDSGQLWNSSNLICVTLEFGTFNISEIVMVIIVVAAVDVDVPRVRYK